MRRIILIIAIICAWGSTHAQINLVHNPSFETHWRCPQYFDLVKYSNYWTSIADTMVSPNDTLAFYFCLPEYCNTCSEYYRVSVPSSLYYYHYPRTGNGMIQMNMFYNEQFIDYLNKRDYLQGKLKSNLVIGEQYCVTFYASLEGGSAYAIDHIGAYFDNGIIDTTASCGLPQSTHVPQVYTNDIINDTVHWTKIQGTFTATGNEQFITIGNFFDANHTDTIATHFPHAYSFVLNNHIVALYLVDDVSVIKVGTNANAGNDTTIYTGDTAWIGEHVGYTGDSAWHNDYDDYAPVKWYTATGTLIYSNHASLHVHPTTTASYVMELDVCGTLSYDTVTVHVHGLGIGSIGMGSARIYPNPASDELHVNGLEIPTTYRLTNITGQLIQQGILRQNKDQLSIAALPAGVYILSLTTTDGTKSNFRIVKQ